LPAWLGGVAIFGRSKITRSVDPIVTIREHHLQSLCSVRAADCDKARQGDPVRTISLSLVLMAAVASPAAGETLLDTVLYVVSTLAPRETAGVRVSVAQDANSIHSELFLSIRSASHWGPFHRIVSVTVKRDTDCKFEVIETYAPTHHDDASYSIDFSSADLLAAHPADVRNNSGHLSHAIVIPGAKFCHTAGRPYFNNIGAGSCKDSFAVGPAFLRPDDAKMLDAIHRLAKFCTPKLTLGVMQR
jgi:hypothetical protein